MTEQHQYRFALAVRGPEIVHLALPQVFNGKTGGGQARSDQLLATGIDRGDGRAGDEIAGEVKNGGHGIPAVVSSRASALPQGQQQRQNQEHRKQARSYNSKSKSERRLSRC